MTSLARFPISAAMPIPDALAIMKRLIGIRRAAQALAEWDYDRRGLQFPSMNLLPSDERAAYHQVAEKVVEAFEEAAFDIAPADREVTRRLERKTFLQMEQHKARLLASERGHELGTWANVEGEHGQFAVCRRCSAVATLQVTYQPLLDVHPTGSAFTNGCLVAADQESR